ncbi:IclR family transcriptional regulator [Corynebacterium suranareeae]|uniref:IclR family transcriptional regulator n=1 Tax=Corynebacterium suranareeae TaxID=2506452 RepID=A0A160PMZ2_9CORY|nr:IclR family transcriptional regulator [Corynebacterium suranareeae]BAU94605.1 IclR family transcriptional regulator [Corynebacterium suranareeae]
MSITSQQEPTNQGEGTENDDSAPELMNRSVLRAMTILSELGNHPNGTTAAEMASITGLARPTVFRLLQSLAHAGMVLKNDKRFSLGLEVARLGRIADPYRTLQPRVQVFVDGLSAELGEASAYSIVEGPSEIHLIAEAPGSYMLSTAMGYIGKDMPLHASAMGKILLAELSDEQIASLLPETLESFTSHTITKRDELLKEIAEVRKQGYSVLDNELEEGLFALAIPVRDRSNHLIGILSVSGLDQRMKALEISGYVNQLQDAAGRLLDTVLEA